HSRLNAIKFYFEQVLHKPDFFAEIPRPKKPSTLPKVLSQKELAHLVSQHGEDGAKENLKEFAMRVMDEYARNFKRLGINNHRDLLWFGKLESYRYYSHNDKEVKNGQKKKGERKDGRQMHVQIIVSRKDT